MEDEMTEVVRSIPLSKLTPSEANVRHTNADVGLDELAASIKAHGLLQNLTVRPVKKSNGKQTGTFEVVAGGRRLRALNRLAQEEHITKNYPVPCRVLENHNPVEVSLAENVVRAPVHAADQFEAYAKLHTEGLGAAEIAGRFGVSPLLVEQRLKLAAVSSKLMDVYREGGMSLDQLMAFTMSDDHEAQERVWFDSPLHDRQPQSIRRALTRALVEGSDRRARFIGAEAYEAAGGVIVRDLFRTDEEGYFSDSQLLDRLVNEKISSKAEELKAAGWAWVEVLPEMDYGYLARMGRIDPTLVPLSEAEQPTLAELTERYDALDHEHGEEPPDEIAKELERLAGEIEKLSEERAEWSAEDKARSGVIIALDYHGNLRVERGLLKPEERKATPKVQAQPEEGNGREPSEPLEEKEARLSDVLLEDLSAHRTAALRAVLSDQPQLALTALLHTLVLRTFYSPVCEACVDVRLEAIDLKRFASGIAESKAMVAMANCHSTWRERLPVEQDLWSWLVNQAVDTKLALLAYCVANTANAVEVSYGVDERRRDQANRIAAAAELDMADWWAPTKDSFFDRVTKTQILAAVVEGVSKEAAENITGLKKAVMAAQAADLLASKRWLPIPLRVTCSAPPFNDQTT